MKNKQALKYIHEHKKEGIEDHTIKSSFSRVGWHPQAVDTLFREYKEYRKRLIKNKKKLMLGSMFFLILLCLFLIGFFVYYNWLM